MGGGPRTPCSFMRSGSAAAIDTECPTCFCFLPAHPCAPKRGFRGRAGAQAEESRPGRGHTAHAARHAGMRACGQACMQACRHAGMHACRQAETARGTGGPGERTQACKHASTYVHSRARGAQEPARRPQGKCAGMTGEGLRAGRARTQGGGHHVAAAAEARGASRWSPPRRRGSEWRVPGGGARGPNGGGGLAEPRGRERGGSLRGPPGVCKGWPPTTWTLTVQDGFGDGVRDFGRSALPDP